MKLYNALIKKNQEEKIENIILLKDGFSWFIFLFSGFWFLYHKMWKESVVIMLITIIFSMLEQIFSPLDKIFLEFIFLFIIAYNGNYWLTQFLERRGYSFDSIICSKDEDEARKKLLQQFTSDDFAISITDPKLHRKLQKSKK
jgi:hypothetical protein